LLPPKINGNSVYSLDNGVRLLLAEQDDDPDACDATVDNGGMNHRQAVKGKKFCFRQKITGIPHHFHNGACSLPRWRLLLAEPPQTDELCMNPVAC
jgi:hypothetical protein